MALPPPRLLRLSVTDRCNFRCRYCMPANAPERSKLLPAIELGELAAWLSVELGIERVRLTGGEPLVCTGIGPLIERLAATPGVREVSLTTNGSLLARLAHTLKRAGLARVNVSLDSVDAARFARLTRGAQLRDTLAGIDAAIAAGLLPLKLNAVLHRSTWMEDVPLLVDYAATRRLEIRFIELMPMGTERNWSDSEFVPADDVRRWLERRAPPAPAFAPPGDPARRTALDWHGVRVMVGWIAPRSHPFCGACERVRLDARGRLRRCLMDPSLFDLAAARRAEGDDAARAALTAYMAAKRAPGSMDSLYSMISVGG